MGNHLVVFEQHAEDYGPLALTRPVYYLRCGFSSLLEKITSLPEYRQETRVHLLTRDHLADVTKQHPDFQRTTGHWGSVNNLKSVRNNGALFIDGAVIATLADKMPPMHGDNEIGVVDETIHINGEDPVTRQRVVYARLDAETYQRMGSIDKLLENPNSLGITVVESGLTVATFPWHLVMNNAEVLKCEYDKHVNNENRDVPEGFFFRGRADRTFLSDNVDISPNVEMDCRQGAEGQWGVCVASGVEIQGNVLLDAREGPIYIDHGTVIEAGSIIQGPAYIGRANIIKQAVIREGCSFGPVCRIGGEIEESIIQGYSNKQHNGFMGHAVVGEWVNWGAGTINSDLKNDYSPVIVELNAGKKIDSGQNKTVGVYIGDHTKTGLGTVINTGTVMGIGSNILMSQLNTRFKHMSSFLIYADGICASTALSTFLDTAETVMGRRDVELTPEYRAMMEHLHRQLKAEARAFSKRYMARK
jgi:hypothetical protein